MIASITWTSCGLIFWRDVVEVTEISSGTGRVFRLGAGVVSVCARGRTRGEDVRVGLKRDIISIFYAHS
jgi:hypothetical protein